MRAVIQSVKEASVEIDGKLYSSIKGGYAVLLGISVNDTDKDIDYIVDKIVNLRIIRDSEDKLNNDIKSIDGEILIISQFTLYGDARKGRRPSYIEAAKGEIALSLYNLAVERLKKSYNENKIFTGVFGAMMNVKIINSGPVTILIDSERKF